MRLSLVRLVHAVEGAQERRLARTGRTDDAQDPAVRDVQRDAAEGGDSVKEHAEALGSDLRRCRFHPRSLSHLARRAMKRFIAQYVARLIARIEITSTAAVAYAFSVEMPSRARM